MRKKRDLRLVSGSARTSGTRLIGSGAILLGDSKKKACALVARRLEQWINERAGCSLREASENLPRREGHEWRRWAKDSRRFTARRGGDRRLHPLRNDPIRMYRNLLNEDGQRMVPRN